MGTVVFGQVLVNVTEVFFRSRLSLAFVNLKPITKGHVLVIPERVVPRFADLTPEEVGDLYLTVQRVGRVIEHAYNAESLSIVMQDGPAAGQTIRHVHVHVIPRRLGDWANNDDIYAELDKKGIDNEQRLPRSREEMNEEAAFLRSLFETFQ